MTSKPHAADDSEVNLSSTSWSTRLKNLGAHSYLLIAVGAFGALAVTVAIYHHYFSGPPSEDPQQWGTYGDYVGGIGGTIVALATLLAVMVTIRLQAKVLDLTQQQLKVTKVELQNSHRQFEIANEVAQRQMFDSAFYNMLQAFRSMAAEIKLAQVHDTLNHSKLNKPGEESFNTISIDFEKEAEYGSTKGDVLGQVMKGYRRFRDDNFNNIHLPRYFRAYYHILSFIHLKCEDAEEAYRYASLLRANSTLGENAIIALNCLRPEGEGLMPYLKHFGMLKHSKEASHWLWHFSGELGIHESAFMSLEERTDAAIPIPKELELAWRKRLNGSFDL